MKKEKVVYRYLRYNGKMIHAKREIPYELSITSRLILDELCFKWNKEKIESEINSSIDKEDKEAFEKWSAEYRHFVWE